MLLKREGRPRPGIKVLGNILLLVTILAMLGGCAWIHDWLNPNQAPVAVISANPTSGEAPIEVSFDASESYDPDGDELSYEWNFDDGNIAEGEIVQHGFGSPRSYTVRLLVTDSKGKSDTSSKIISVSQPSNEITKEQTFEAQDGTQYDSGTGLKVFVPPDPSGGQKKLAVTENSTPQQPEGGFIELQSVYNVSLTSESSSQEGGITPKSGSESNSKVRLTFEIPPGVDPGNVMILQRTEEGWRLASSGESSTTTPTFGGVLNPDGRSISIEGPSSCLTSTSISPQGLGSWWKSTRVALCNFKDNIVNKFDCSPIYPDIEEEAFENKGTYIEKKVLLRSPKRGFGGIWFKVEVEGSHNLVETPQWDPPSHYELERWLGYDLGKWLSGHEGWYLSPTEDEAGTLTLRFPPQGGKVRISLDAGESLGAQISGWIISMVPFGDLSEAVIEEIWTLVDDAIRGVGISHSTRWSEVAVKTKELVYQIIKGAAEKEIKEVTKIAGQILNPLNLVTVIANEITYNWTIASSQAGYCEYGHCTREVNYIPKNRPPVADAGVAQEVSVGASVTLNGSESSDADAGDSLTYHWEQIDGPKVTLTTDLNDPKATFIPTEPGTYKFKLVVNDGKVDSEPDHVIIDVKGQNSSSQVNYKLPYPGGLTCKVSQGNNSSPTHTGKAKYAFDFVTPDGSSFNVPAAAAGRVLLVKDDSNVSGGWEARNKANYVVIEHNDGYCSLYLHLKYHSVVVKVGQWVQQGKKIAESGETGYATGVHLHFQLQKKGSWWEESVPISFSVVSEIGGVTLEGHYYTSENF